MEREEDSRQRLPSSYFPQISYEDSLALATQCDLDLGRPSPHWHGLLEREKPASHLCHWDISWRTKLRVMLRSGLAYRCTSDIGD